MPELPEVETTVRGLQKKVLGRTFIDIWTDAPKLIKKPKSFEQFKKEIKGMRIQKIWRRGKNIIFNLSGDRTLLIHQKLTGHLLFGKWTPTRPPPSHPDKSGRAPKEKVRWQVSIGPLSERINSYIHLLFIFDNGQMLALSDLRKFAKVELWKSKELAGSKELKKLGPEPLEKNFNFWKFKETLKEKKGKIKQVLMNQEVIAGIGNIYSDEILFKAKIHPLRKILDLKTEELKRIYQAMKRILQLAINLQGESISDYRTPTGERGNFDKERKVYRKTGEKCSRCRTLVKRIKIGGRSAHFCPKCQKL